MCKLSAVGSKPTYRVIGPTARRFNSSARSVQSEIRPRHSSSSRMFIAALLSRLGGRRSRQNDGKDQNGNSRKVVPSSPPLLFEVVEIVADSTAISARHLVLVQSALSLALGCPRSFFKLHRALAGDANTLKGNARHRASRRHLAANLSGHQVCIMLRVTAIRQPARIHVRTSHTGVIDGFLMIRKVGPSCFFGPGTDRSEEHTSELQSRFGISYAVFC